MNFLFKKICIASDHAGYNLKEQIKNHLINNYVSIFDMGPYKKESVDYPDYAKKIAKRVKDKKSDIGILVCGSGTGMAISANKYKVFAQLFATTLVQQDCLGNTIMLI